MLRVGAGDLCLDAVPCSGGLSTSRRPPRASTRAARPRRLEPRVGSAPPTPSSHTVTVAQPFDRRMFTVAGRARAYLATFVIASATTYIAASTGSVRRSGSSAISTDTGAAPAAHRARPRPCSASRAGCSCARALAARRCPARGRPGPRREPHVGGPRMVLDVRAEHPELEGDGDEALLRAVVQIAPQSPALGVADLHESARDAASRWRASAFASACLTRSAKSCTAARDPPGSGRSDVVAATSAPTIGPPPGRAPPTRHGIRRFASSQPASCLPRRSAPPGRQCRCAAPSRGPCRRRARPTCARVNAACRSRSNRRRPLPCARRGTGRPSRR